MRFDMWKSKAQKGAFLVFTALMIPIIFICAGFAVDLGNAWAYKSKLQNAADAAALAGAKEYGDNGTETLDSHASADAQAERFLIANLGRDYFNKHLADGSTGKTRFQMKPLTQKDNTKSYYRVYLSAQTDTTFMKMFNYDHMDVGVEAVAVVPTRNEGTIDFNNLIDLGTRIEGGSSFYNNNGSDTDYGQLHNTKIGGSVFDGTVVYNNHDEYNELFRHEEYWPEHKIWYGTEMNGIYRFFTPEAKKDVSRYDAIQKNHYQWPQEGNLTDYHKKAESVENALEALYKNHADEIQESIPFGQKIYVPLSFSQSHYYIFDSNINHELNIDIKIMNFGSSDNPNPQGITPKNINGQNFYVDDTPVYLYIKGEYQTLKIEFEEDITHPVVICYLGHSNIQLEGHDRSFIGTIYAPNATIIPYNSDRTTFVGSITTDRILLNSTHGYFKFWNFGIPSNGKSGNTSGASAKLQLVISDKEGLTWSDD